MSYKKPLQPRAVVSEERLLEAMVELLNGKPLARITIEEIAQQAHLTKGAFLKRFGSKKQALLVLWERYIAESVVLKERLVAKASSFKTAVEACTFISQEIEAMQSRNFSINRAMHEEYSEDLLIHPGTQKIFMECVDLVQRVRQRFTMEATPKDERDFAAAQLLISLNYYSVLKAMPGLPADAVKRHHLIGRLVVETLKH